MSLPGIKASKPDSPPIDDLSEPKTPPSKRRRVPNPNLTFTPERTQELYKPSPLTPARCSNSKSSYVKDAHRRLVFLTQLNKQQELSSPDWQSLQDSAEILITTMNSADPSNPEQFSRTIKDCVEFLKVLSEFPVTKGIPLFYKLLNELRRLDPGLNVLFWDTDCQDFGPSLSPYAINDLFQYFRDNFHHLPEILSCRGVSELVPLVNEFIRGSSESHPMRGYAIFNDLPGWFQKDCHIVPVFMQKFQGKNHLFIFDSKGHELHSRGRQEMSISLVQLMEYFEQFEHAPSEPLIIYSLKTRRQSCPVGCATFTIDDLKHCYERTIFPIAQSLPEFYANQTGDFEPQKVKCPMKNIQLYEIYNLPFELMASTQSYQTMHRLEESSPPFSSPPLVERYSREGLPFQKALDFDDYQGKIAENRRMLTDDKARNLYIERKRCSEIVTLINRYYSLSR